MVELIKLDLDEKSLYEYIKLGQRLAEQYPVWNCFRVVKTNLPSTSEFGKTCGWEKDLYWMVYAGLRIGGFMFDLLIMNDENFNEEHIVNAEKVIIVDLDGTLARTEYNSGWKIIEVNQGVVDIVNTLYNNGYLVVVNTSRSSKFYRLTLEQLKEIGVRYDGIVFDKLFGNFIVDDAVVIEPKAFVKLFRLAWNK